MSIESSYVVSEFWPTELWASKRELFWAAKFVLEH